MICLQEVKRYCKEYWKIENFEEAVNDPNQTWHCHHRHEIEYNLSKIELQVMGFYFNRPFCELIFLTPEEHMRLHMKGINHEGKNNPNYGKEGYWKGKEGYWKGKVGPNKGRHHTERTKQKMTKIHISEEELYDLFVVQGLSTYKIAKKYGCSQVCIWNKLKKYNIKK